jgi:hypothetical protein
VASGMMRRALESQERVDGRYGRRVCGANANLSAARTSGSVIRDVDVARRHHGCTWDCLGVHPEWPGKVSGSKRDRDVAHVLLDRGDPSGVGRIVRVKDDPPTIYKVLKNVRRRVLINAHDRLTTGLHGRECTV